MAELSHSTVTDGDMGAMRVVFDIITVQSRPINPFVCQNSDETIVLICIADFVYCKT